MHIHAGRYLNSGDGFVRARQKKLVVILGQSNGANGQQSTVNLGTSQRKNIGSAYAAVTYYQKSAQTRADPPTYDVNISGASLSSYTSSVNNNSGHGIDGTGLGIIQSLGRHLDYYDPNHWIVAAFGVSGTDASNDWAPSGPFPSSGGCLLTQAINYINSVLTATGARLACIIWDQGESDALDPTKAANYQTNAQAIWNTLRASFPVPIVFKRLPSTNTATNLAAVRTAQANLASANSYATMVDSDKCQLTDGTHFSADSYAAMGDRYALAVLTALGYTIQNKAWTIDPVLLVATPQNATEWAALLAASGAANTGGPSRLYLLQEAAAPVADSIGGISLALTGTTPTFQNTNPNTQLVAVQFTALGQGELASTNAALPNPATTSWARFCYAYWSSNAAARNAWLLGTAGFEAIAINNTTGFQVSSGGNTTAGTQNPANTLTIFGEMRDITHATSKGYHHLEKVATTQGAVTGKKITLGQNAANMINAAYFYMVDFDGTNAEKSDADWKAIWATANWGNTNLGASALPW